jgi:hypothetical protein
MRPNVMPLALALVLTTTAASADPIRITSGRVSGSVSSITDFQIEGDGFVISGVLGAAAPFEPHFRCGGGCPVDSEVDLSTPYTLDSVEINGIVYSGVTGSFRFDSESIRLPDLPVGSRATFARIFSFQGSLAGLDTLGTLDLTGTGVVFAFVRNEGTGGIAINRTDYVFADLNPVPEPGTLLLVGGGLAAAWRRSRARRPLSRLP